LTQPLDEEARFYYRGFGFIPPPLRHNRLLEDLRRFIRGVG